MWGLRECGVVECTRKMEGGRSEEYCWKVECHRSIPVLWSTSTAPCQWQEHVHRLLTSRRSITYVVVAKKKERGRLSPSKNLSARAAQKHQLVSVSSASVEDSSLSLPGGKPGQCLLLFARSKQVDLSLTRLTTFPSHLHHRHPTRLPRPPLLLACSWQLGRFLRLSLHRPSRQALAVLKEQTLKAQAQAQEHTT